MKRRILFVLVGAAVAWTVVANSLPAAQPPAADWSRPHSIQSAGLTVYFPRAWHATTDGITIVISSPDVWIWLANYGPKFADEWPTRPKHFELRHEDFGFQTCGFGFEGWNLGFTDHGRVVQAGVRRYPGANESDAIEVLDRLVIG